MTFFGSKQSLQQYQPMRDERIREMIEEWLRLCDAVQRLPFPYEDCRTLLREAGGHDEGLIPDLDFFFSTIAGYCSWRERILQWSEEQINDAEAKLARSFFEQFPQHKSLERLITERNTPNLFAQIESFEKIRKCLLELFSEHKGADREP